MPTDKFKLNGIDKHDALQSPITQFISITKSDTNELSDVVRGVYVQQSGYLKIRLENDTEPTTIPVHEAQLLPFRVIHVYETGTTATVVGVQ